MWFAIGFFAAVACCTYLISGSILLLLASLFSIISVILFFVPKDILKKAALVVLGLAVGFLYCWSFDRTVLEAVRELDGQNETLSIEATDYSFDTGYGSAVDGRVQIDGRKYKLRLYFDDMESIAPGDVITADVKLRYTPEGGSEDSTYHKGEGVFLLGYAGEDMEIEKAHQLPGKYFPAYLRKTIAQQIAKIFPKSTAAFAKALLLGDDSDLVFQDDYAFQKSGIRHIIAVSGLHVSILFAVLYFFIGRNGLLTLLIGVPVLFLFAAVAGFTPSVVRACLMQGLIILSIAVDKEYDPVTALSFAATVMLLINPLTVTSVSFQLSVGSMIGISVFSGRIRNYLQSEKRLGMPRGKSIKSRLKRWFIGSISVSIGALIFTMPLCAIHFGMVSMISIVTNLLTLWVVFYIFCGIMAGCILSALWMPLGIAVGWIVSVPIQYVLLVARLFSKIPFGVAYTDSPYTVLWIICTFLLILAFSLFKKRSAILLVISVCFLYGLSMLATWAEPRLDGFRLTVLDVGQGQCVLLQCKDEAYLIDCGGNDSKRTANIALNALGSQGITRLDGLILTHYDDDHAGGAVYLTQVFPVEQVYLPDSDPENEIRCLLEEQDLPIVWVRKNMDLSCGPGELSIYPIKNQSQGNESSMCILFQGENCDILITGDRNMDGESQLLEQADIPNLEVLVVGHHGASTSTGLELLYKTKPDIAVISVGEDNLYDHPHREVLERLERAGCLIRRTDREGNIMIRG